MRITALADQIHDCQAVRNGLSLRQQADPPRHLLARQRGDGSAIQHHAAALNV